MYDNPMFYTSPFSTEDQQYFLTHIWPRFLDDIQTDLETNTGGILTIGTPVSVDIDSNFFYVPILEGRVIAYIICFTRPVDADAPYAALWGRLFADELNGLLPGEVYRLVNHRDSVYAVGDDKAVLLLEMNVAYTDPLPEDGEDSPPVLGDVQGLNRVDMRVPMTGADAVSITKKTHEVLGPGEGSKALAVPWVPNRGNPGYGVCWLAASLSIINYHRNTNYTTNSATHDGCSRHTSHNVDKCPGGSLADAKETLSRHGVKNGTSSYVALGGVTLQKEIESNRPVYVAFGHYTANIPPPPRKRLSGHAIVLCGYTYKKYQNPEMILDRGMSMTYKLVDNNVRSSITLSTQLRELYFYSDSSIRLRYNISGKIYEFEEAVYEIK